MSPSGRLPIERSDDAVATALAVAAVAQLALGLYRARLTQSSPAPAIALSLLVAAIGAVWVLRRRELPGGFLSRPFALVLATAGALSGYSAIAAPLIGTVARVSTPLFALSAAALLVFAEASPRVQVVTAAAFLVALAVLEIALMNDAIWSAAAVAAALDG